MTQPARGVRASMTAAAALAAAVAFASPGRAAVHYTFELIGTGDVLGGFTYTTTDFITADRSVAPADLDSCTTFPTGTCKNQDFHISSVGFISGAVDLYDVIGFGTQFPSSGSTSFHYFANGAFGAVGVYTATLLTDDNSRLTVTKDAVTGGVPEPSSWALMLLGFGGLGAALRRRARAAA